MSCESNHHRDFRVGHSYRSTHDRDGYAHYSHHHDSCGNHSKNDVAGYLDQEGLSFKFGHYQIAIGDEGNDTLIGGATSNFLWGLAGNDSIAGKDEHDILYGDSGDDVMTGRGGADRLEGGRGNDKVYGGDEADMVMGGPGNDYVDEGQGHGGLDGGPGDDMLVGGQGPDAFFIGPTSGDDVIKDFTAGPGMFDHLALQNLRWDDLRFEDTSAGVKISWEDGSVVLEGVNKSQLSQDDFMFAERPDLPPSSHDADGPQAERPTTSTDGPDFPSAALPGIGFDQIADKALQEGGLGFTFCGDHKYKIEVGTQEADYFRGGHAFDHFFGSAGNDRASGNGGDDVLHGDEGNDVLRGGAGVDRLDGGMAEDWLFGGSGGDELMGMDGNDYLNAGAGHDMIEGGKGNDSIAGGTGADAFLVDPDSGFDTVLDFEARGDAQGAFDHLALMEIMPDQVSVADTLEGALVTWSTDNDVAPEGSVLLQNVFKADLRQSDFMFNDEAGFVAGVSDVGSGYIF